MHKIKFNHLPFNHHDIFMEYFSSAQYQHEPERAMLFKWNTKHTKVFYTFYLFVCVNQYYVRYNGRKNIDLFIRLMPGQLKKGFLDHSC